MKPPSDHFVALADALSSGERVPGDVPREDLLWLRALKEVAAAQAQSWAAECPSAEAVTEALRGAAPNAAVVQHIDSCPLCAPLKELTRPASLSEGAGSLLSGFLDEARRVFSGPSPAPVPVFQSSLGRDNEIDWRSDTERVITAGPYTITLRPSDSMWTIDITPAPGAGELRLKLVAGTRSMFIRLDRPHTEVTRASWERASIEMTKPAPRDGGR